jgi:hypothetical protein
MPTLRRDASSRAFEFTPTTKDPKVLRQELSGLGYLALEPPRDYEATMHTLREFLRMALVVELGTIPPYMTALYTIRPEAPWRAGEALRAIVVEEMLHLVLAANVLNAIGGKPVLYSRDVMIDYPKHLPFGIDRHEVGLLHFSEKAVDQGLQIEEPAEPDAARIIAAANARSDATFENVITIGEFYLIVESKLRAAVRAFGEERVFCGDPANQVGLTQYYYDGGGGIAKVGGLGEAVKAMRQIRDQGEGIARSIWTDPDVKPGDDPDDIVEVAHYYRFDELKRKRLYKHGDEPHDPTGEHIDVPFDRARVYETKANPKLADYKGTPEIHDHALAFNVAYCGLLRLVERALNGEPNLLLEAVPAMMTLRYRAEQLVRNPLPGGKGLHAGPTFEYADLSD